MAGRLQASLRFAQISEIWREIGGYLQGILEQCREIHDLIYAVYIQYSVETALARIKMILFRPASDEIPLCARSARV